MWDRGEYQAVPGTDHGTLKCKMEFAPVFGAPDETEAADQIKIQSVSVRPTRNANRPTARRACQGIDLSKFCQQESGYFKKPVVADRDGADNRRHVCYDPNRVGIDWRTYLRSGPN